MQLSGRHYVGFTLSGHAGFDRRGRDIVCAAVSSAAFLTANTLEMAGLAQCSQGENSLHALLTQQSEQGDLLLRGLLQHLRELAKQYPGTIEIIYGGTSNA